jgi:signal transduction histidine kinase/HAMP domain-containing protein
MNPRRLLRLRRPTGRHRFRTRLLTGMLAVSLVPLAIFAAVVALDLGSISRSTVDEANNSILADQVDAHQHQLAPTVNAFQTKLTSVTAQLKALHDAATIELTKPAPPPAAAAFDSFQGLHFVNRPGLDTVIAGNTTATGAPFDAARAAADSARTATLVPAMQAALAGDGDIQAAWIADADGVVVRTVPTINLAAHVGHGVDPVNLLGRNGNAPFSAVARDAGAAAAEPVVWSTPDAPQAGFDIFWSDSYPAAKAGELGLTAWSTVTVQGAHRYKVGVDVAIGSVAAGLLDPTLGGQSGAFTLLLSSGNLLLGMAGGNNAVKDMGLPAQWGGTQLPLATNSAFAQGMLGVERTGRASALPATLGSGTDYEFFTATITPTHWVVATAVPKTNLLPEQPGLSRGIETGVRRILLHVIPVALLLCGLAFLLATLLARRLVGPVGALTVAAERLADGHTDEAVPPQGHDEVGMLATSLERMRREVNASRDGILAAARELEQRVADRTIELRARNEELVALNTLAGSLTRSLDPHTILGDALETLRAVLPVVAARGYVLVAGQPRALAHWSADGKSELSDDLATIAAAATEGRDLAMRPGASGPLIGLPLEAGDTVLGAIALVARPGWRLAGRTRTLLRAVSDQVGLALRTAELSAEGRELAVLEERTRLAREIHDTLAQQLTAIVLQLEAAEAFIGRDEERAHGVVVVARDLARSALQEARRSVWNLRPAPLAATGLVAAIQLEVKRWQARTGIPAVVLTRGLPVPLAVAPQAEVAMFRILQEALSNVARHSRAEHVEVVLEECDGSLCLTVEDDGEGLEVSRTAGPDSFGLLGMEERAKLVGAELELSGAPGQGTRVIVRLPLGVGAAPAVPVSA